MFPKYGQNTIAIPKTARAKARGQKLFSQPTLIQIDKYLAYGL